MKMFIPLTCRLLVVVVVVVVVRIETLAFSFFSLVVVLVFSFYCSCYSHHVCILNIFSFRLILSFFYHQERMAESTSPALSRSPHKLEYASCINTSLSSPTPVPTYHSSFDYLSQPRDCQRLVTMKKDLNATPQQTLERDLCRLDIDSSQQRSVESRKKKLDRTESISLPTTPVEQLSPSLLSYNHQYHRSVLAKNPLNDGDDDDEQELPSPTLPDYILNVPEQSFLQASTDESISNSKR